jgi:exosome complex RNA-binding protein Rrp4
MASEIVDVFRVLPLHLLLESTPSLERAVLVGENGVIWVTSGRRIANHQMSPFSSPAFTSAFAISIRSFLARCFSTSHATS